MCTVSLAPSPDGRALRLVVNRDERRLRPCAWPPQVSEVAGLRVVWPVDPVGRGTWVAANEAGLVFALLNLHTGTPKGTETRKDAEVRRSRARVIPALAGAFDLEDVRAGWARLDVSEFEPFRLVVASGSQAAVMSWHGESRAIAVVDLREPLMLTSSSLGTGLAEQPRHELFRAFMEPSATDPWRAQDRFHQHAWPDRRQVSVLMSRPDACTVSRTVVTLSATRVDLAYYPLVDGWAGPVSRARLSMRVASGAPSAVVA